jgi:hypothetical protein
MLELEEHKRVVNQLRATKDDGETEILLRRREVETLRTEID